MPIISGYEATKIIRNKEKNTNTYIPIIALTANATESEKEKCLQEQIDAYTTKPVNISILLENINKVLNLKK